MEIREVSGGGRAGGRGGALLAAAGAAALVCAGALAPAARAEIPPYALVGTYAGPSGWDAFDVMPDGRVLFVVGSEFRAADVRTGAPAAVIGGFSPSIVSSFGAAFVSVSPDGSLIALGDNNFGPSARVHWVSSASLTPGVESPTASVASANGEACWADGSTLLVAGFGTGPQVTRIDTTAATAEVVITGIAEGTGGVAVRGGRVFVGAGFDFSGGTVTGQVRAFELASLSGASPAGFFSGTLVARALSGSSLGFDAAGNLLVGGGDFFAGSGDFGSAAVIDGASVAGALAGGPIDPIGAQVRLSPAGAGVYYNVRFNAATAELLVAAEGTIYRYAVPGPGASGLALLLGVAAARRRRRA